MYIGRVNVIRGGCSWRNVFRYLVEATNVHVVNVLLFSLKLLFMFDNLQYFLKKTNTFR